MRNRLIATGMFVIGLYCVTRAGLEFAWIDWGDPASYAQDWGGPSLAGVLLVHCGPGAVALGWGVARLRRRIAARRGGRPGTGAGLPPGAAGLNGPGSVVSRRLAERGF